MLAIRTYFKNALMTIRAAARWSRRPLDPLPEDLTGHCPDSGSGPLGEIGDCLAPMLNALPPKIREALVLADLEGVKQRQVSERLGISLASVKSRILR